MSREQEKNNEGTSAFVFDRKVMEESALSEIVRTPPSWMIRYYADASDVEPFAQIMDVALPKGCRYSSKTDEAARVFLDFPPASLVKLRK